MGSLSGEKLTQMKKRTNEEIVSWVKADFDDRREKRRSFEQSWLLNMNFLIGNQYSYINPRGEIEVQGKAYPWESREVFNHIAPIIESRLAKLGRVRPSLGVRPAGSSVGDLEKAKTSKTILDSVSANLNLSKIIGDATVWSEVCGTAFYKAVWNESAGSVVGFTESGLEQENGNKVGKKISGFETIEDVKSLLENSQISGKIAENSQNNAKNILNCAENNLKSQKTYQNIPNKDQNIQEIDENTSKNTKNIQKNTKKYPLFEGDVSVMVCSPFEIYPESSGASEVDELASIIHARVVDAEKIEEVYGVKVVGETLNTLAIDLEKAGFDLNAGASVYKKMVGGKKDNQVLLIERWEKPSQLNPEGRLTIIAGDELLFDGAMPYEAYPFVKQVSSPTIGSFWGTSIIDRCIPVQRAYNAIKNRKLECIARLCGGVLAVEEGSVDIDDLESDGLAPGKILVYRSGSPVPSFMPAGTIPNELSEEEERLKNELISLTGVSELMRNSALPNSVTSGTAINLLIEQDDTRLSASAENIRNSLLILSKNILNLYKKFATTPKLSKVLDENGDLQLFYWSGADISSDDVVLETSNELSESIASRKNMVLELLKLGLLNGEDGRLDEHTKAKVIEMMGFGNWENSTDLMSLQIKRARCENVSADDIVVLEVDNHAVHIKEHTKHILEKNLTSGDEFDKLIAHIRMHQMLSGGHLSSDRNYVVRKNIHLFG